MTYEQLQSALDRYGGDLTRWPEAMRREAEDLTKTDAKAAKALTAAAKLDGALAAAVAPMAVDAAFLGQLISRLDRLPNGREPALRPTRRLVAWVGAAMVLFLTAGFAAGVALPQSQSDETLAGLMFGSAFVSDSSSGSVL